MRRYLQFILILGICATASPLYGQYPYPPYGWPYPYDISGSARIQVTPKDAEVYVDGGILANFGYVAGENRVSG